MLLLAPITALAATPTADVHAVGGVGAGEVAGGVGGSVGLTVQSFDLELAADLALGPGSLGLVRPQARWSPLGTDRPGPHVLVGGGVMFADGSDDGALVAGLGGDLSVKPWRPRVQLLGALRRDNTTAVLLTLGLAHRPARKTAPAGVAPDFDAAMVWVPGPVCQWLPSDEASDAFLGVDADPERVEKVPNPTGGTGGTAGEGPRGDLVVAAFPGDVVTVDDRPLEVADDGVAWSNLPEGPATVRVLGGGRRVVFDLAVAADATLWVTVPEAEKVELRFRVGSADLEGSSASTLDQLADTLGAWRVRVWGSYSAEGDRVANEALAQQRAEHTRDRLVAAGVPPENVEVLPPRTPLAERSLEDQRVAVLELVPPEAP